MMTILQSQNGSALIQKSLIQNLPSKSEPWKASVKDWLHELDEKAKKKSMQKQRRKEQAKKNESQT